MKNKALEFKYFKDRIGQKENDDCDDTKVYTFSTVAFTRAPGMILLKTLCDSSVTFVG